MDGVPQFLSIAEASKLIERRTLSPVELTKAILNRIAKIDPQLNACLLVTADLAMDQARAAEAAIMAGHWRGPMHGIPYALKDIYCTKGIRTTSHSRTRADCLPEFDATTVTRLHHAGAVLLGKLSTHEVAHGGPSYDLPWPPARNPWNRDYFTGGSSSGSGAAVASGLAMAALGSDTGGSIQCIGFTPDGLPLAMQIVGRPFDEATVLRAAHAYENATSWRASRPVLDPDVSFSTELPAIPAPAKADISLIERDQIASICRRAGLSLNERHFEQLCATAPYIEVMTGRLNRTREFYDEPSSVFVMTPDG